MILETERLRLRNFNAADLEDTFAYCCQADVGEMAGWPAHGSRDETAKHLAQWSQNPNRYAIVLKENQRVIGHISLDEDSEEGRADTRELGCALNRDYQRRGLMTEAMRVLITEAFKGGIEYIWACCFQQNTPSKRLIEACGFQFQQDGMFYAKGLDQTFSSYEYRITCAEWSARSTQ